MAGPRGLGLPAWTTRLKARLSGISMDLKTKCVRCGTVFPVSMDQLQLRKGYIRCVSCGNIFDGYAAVVPEEAAAASPPAAGLPAAGAQAPSVVRQRMPRAGQRAGVRVPVEPSLGADREEPDDSATVPGIYVEPRRASSSGRIEPAATDVDADPAIYVEPASYADTFPYTNAPEPGSAHGAFSIPVDSTDVLPDFLRTRRQHRRGIAHFFWSVLVLAGLVLLAAQLIFVYRTQIANDAPLLRPVLEQACVSLRCKVGYSHRIERIAIMDSSLQAVTSDRSVPNENTMQLRVVLRNSYDKPQAWPSLVLDLIDFSGSIVVRRRLYPQDYLPADNLKGPFAAGSEVRIMVPITVSGVKINGYQLGKFYAPEG
ncbi:MAG: DUF3426 domain-containing protein [Burkholderiaceae bacterium]|nr:MAG: DUF3426 domain-containing protein [Burkholderiaceae bacterium]TAM05645.1 MAG: DUF3426 domain-containing protein [Pusillimonas sp.]